MHQLSGNVSTRSFVRSVTKWKRLILRAIQERAGEINFNWQPRLASLNSQTRSTFRWGRRTAAKRFQTGLSLPEHRVAVSASFKQG